MTGTDFGHFAYLMLLLIAVGGYFFASNRQNMGQMARHAVLWGLIFIGVIGAVGAWDSVRNTVTPRQMVSESGQITLPRDQGGHYFALVEVNGHEVPFMVDTGATDILLTQDAAEQIGLDPAGLVFSASAQTANGRVRMAPVRLESLRLGPVSESGVRAFVNEGDLDISLLGMSFLDRFSRIEIAQGALVLTP